MRRVPITLMASLATLRDLGRAYWVHSWDSSWMAKIWTDICMCFKSLPSKRHLSVNLLDPAVPLQIAAPLSPSGRLFFVCKGLFFYSG